MRIWLLKRLNTHYWNVSLIVKTESFDAGCMELVNFNGKRPTPAATLHPTNLSYKPAKSIKFKCETSPEPGAPLRPAGVFLRHPAKPESPTGLNIADARQILKIF